MCSGLHQLHRQNHSCTDGTCDSEISEHKCFMLLVHSWEALINKYNAQGEILDSIME